VKTIWKLEEVDADPDGFLLVVNDDNLAEVVDFLLNAANVWREKGWVEKGRWGLEGFEGCGWGRRAGGECGRGSGGLGQVRVSTCDWTTKLAVRHGLSWLLLRLGERPSSKI